MVNLRLISKYVTLYGDDEAGLWDCLWSMWVETGRGGDAVDEPRQLHMYWAPREPPGCETGEWAAE